MIGDHYGGGAAGGRGGVRAVTVLAPVALRGAVEHECTNSVVALVGQPGACRVLRAAVSPWAGPHAGLFWLDARLQDLEHLAARMGELPLAYQEADATSRAKLFDLVGQYSTRATKTRAKANGDLLPRRYLTGTLLLESRTPLMTPESAMQDTTLQFVCPDANMPEPPASGVAGPRLVSAVLKRTSERAGELRVEYGRLKEEFRARRVSMGFDPSRTWRLDARHAAVELAHRVLIEELGLIGSYDTDEGFLTEWREPMIAAGQAEARRRKPA